MRNVWWVAVMLAVVGCGKSSTETPLQIDFDADVGVTDVSDSADTAADAAVGETARPDLETLVMDREVTFQDGESERLAFNVPDDAVSVTVAILGDKGTQYVLSEWTNGDRTDLVPHGWVDTDQAAPSLCLSCPERVAAAESAFAAILPNNESVAVVPGTHNITAYAFTAAGFAIRPLSSGTARVRVVVKRLPAPPESGVLDVNFYLTGARGWTAATAADDPDLQEIVSALQTIYDQVNIKLGVITYNDIPEEYSVVENVLAGPDLQELFALSANQPRTAVNVFLIDELFLGSGPRFSVLLGVSGGIPGPPVGGTPRSGVAINTKGDPNLPIPTGNVIAHEVGHHLGLFHSSEAMQQGQPTIHDPIADTPENDTSLLMYTAGDGTILTTTQGMVMRGNVFVNHQEAP